MDGIRINGSARVDNFGTVTATAALGTGIKLDAGGGITNEQQARGSANTGISITGGDGTITNSGAIDGSGGTAVSFGAGDDWLIVDPGASFAGKSNGGTGANTLELRAGAATGTLTGLGSSFVNFGHVAIDLVATWV